MLKQSTQSALVAALVFGASMSAYAQTDSLPSPSVDPYLGFSVTGVDFSIDAVSNDKRSFSAGFGVVRAGLEIVADNFSVETRLGGALSSGQRRFESNENPGEAFTVEPSSLWGAYAVPALPITQRVSVYGLLGFSEVQFDVDTPENGFGQSVAGWTSDMSYGAGIDYQLSDNVELFGELMRYVDTDEVMMQSLGAGVMIAF